MTTDPRRNSPVFRPYPRVRRDDDNDDDERLRRTRSQPHSPEREEQRRYHQPTRERHRSSLTQPLPRDPPHRRDDKGFEESPHRRQRRHQSPGHEKLAQEEHHHQRAEREDNFANRPPRHPQQVPQRPLRQPVVHPQPPDPAAVNVQQPKRQSTMFKMIAIGTACLLAFAALNILGAIIAGFVQASWSVSAKWMHAFDKPCLEKYSYSSYGCKRWAPPTLLGWPYREQYENTIERAYYYSPSGSGKKWDEIIKDKMNAKYFGHINYVYAFGGLIVLFILISSLVCAILSVFVAPHFMLVTSALSATSILLLLIPLALGSYCTSVNIDSPMQRTESMEDYSDFEIDEYEIRRMRTCEMMRIYFQNINFKLNQTCCIGSRPKSITATALYEPVYPGTLAGVIAFAIAELTTIIATIVSLVGYLLN